MSAPVRIELVARFPVALREGFDYITDLAHWPEYWPRLVRIDPLSQWQKPDDQARLALRMLGREVELELTLVRIDPYLTVEYTSEQAGLPAARHWRHFEAAENGFAYRIAVEYEPRSGPRSLFDRLLVRGAIERVARETIANLDRRFRDEG